MTRARSAVRGVPAVAALALVLGIVACGDDASDGSAAQARPAVPSDAPVLAGRSGGLAIFLTPLHVDAGAHAFARDRLAALVGRRFAFFDVFLFNLGDDRIELGVAPGALRLDGALGGRACESVQLAQALERPGVRASVLPALALETFAGQRLEPGAAVKALVAFDAEVQLSRVMGGTADLGSGPIALRQERLGAAELEALRGRPTREQVTASLGTGAKGHLR